MVHFQACKFSLQVFPSDIFKKNDSDIIYKTRFINFIYSIKVKNN